MRDQPKCSAPDLPALVDPEVPVFRHIALLNVPEPWRPALRQLGEQLFKLSIEEFGIANECPGPVEITAARLEALAADLRCAAEQLASIECEAGDTGRVYARLCRSAGGVAGVVFEAADRLHRVALEVLDLSVCHV